MKRRVFISSKAAFTIVELMMAAAVASVVGLAIFSVVNAAMFMTARNLSVNLTNNNERGALDRVEQLIQQAYTMPTLISATGAAATSPAPGCTFDYFVGGPYVISATGSSLPSSTTTLTLVRSTNVVVSPPIPAVGDVVMINGAVSTLRPRIASVTVGATDGSLHQSIVVTLSAALGTAVTIPSSGLTASLVHMVAVMVMPVGSGRELRYYNNYETTTNYNDSTKYILLTDQVGTQASDATPFSLATIQSSNFVGFSLRVRSNKFDQRLNGKQADQFNSFARVDVYIRPKINPQ